MKKTIIFLIYIFVIITNKDIFAQTNVVVVPIVGDSEKIIHCDGNPYGGLINDVCGVCGGNGTSCAGCDGVPNSGLTLDKCGVCGGDGFSCCEVNCNVSDTGYQISSILEDGSAPCIIRNNTIYEQAFFELCGNDHKSIPDKYRVEPKKESDYDRYITLWIEVNAPWGVDGTVWFDGICLTIGENKTQNFAPNPAYCEGLSNKWESKVNPMSSRYPEYEVCSMENVDKNCTAWEGIDTTNSKYSTKSLKVKIKSGHRYHTFINYQNFIDLNNYDNGTEINASVWVKIEGDVQVRLGLDFRDTVDSEPDKMVNGKIIQFPINGPFSMDWTLLKLN